MKQRIIVALTALFYLTVGYAANISIDGITMKPGETKAIMISLSSGASLSVGVQFDLTLPEGFSLEKNGDALYTISTNQASDMTCNVKDLGNRSFRFVLYSSSLKNLKAGELMSVYLKAGSSITLASYTISVGGIAFSDNNGNVTKESGTQTIVKVTNFFTLLYKVDGATYKSYEIEYGATITPELAPTKEGYTFSGWSEIPSTMPAKDVTVTGTFTVNTYKLSYYVDGVEYKSYQIEYGKAITPEPAPTKDGYVFSGWSNIPATMPAQDVTVTGTFTRGSFKLTYIVDGVTYKTVSYEYGATITPEAEPTKEGYTFSGWSYIPTTMPAENVTVTGSFTINKYKFTYMLDGEVYKTYEIEYGTWITPEPAPTKEGYTFSGWSNLPSTMPAYDVTVYGTFSKGAYTLTYIVDGVIYKTVSYEYGEIITPETEPTKEGYTFNGWSETPSTMPAKDVTVTGTFTVNTYKLIYYVDSEEYKSYEIEYGETITPEAEPTKEGYTFSGWSEIPATMPANDVTVTGTFTVNSYKLTYMIDDDVYKEVMYEYGATITPEPQPDGNYVSFEWIGLPETMPANDVTVYASYETGIINVLMPQGVKAIYAPNGKKLDKLQTGVNIILMIDGRTKKVMVK